MGERRRLRRTASSAAAALLLGSAGNAFAQAVPEAPPPPPDTTVQEPIAEPDAPPTEQKPKEPVKDEGPTHVPPDASGIDLTTLETRNLALLYFDPAQTYLTPYIGRSFENALAWHKKRFDWEPWERTTVLLKDFSDYGNAGARSTPNNALLLDVAPLSISMETFTPGERFFTIINHEIAHVATMDAWNARDARWRKLLKGKIAPIQEHPETILYNYLTAPRNM